MKEANDCIGKEVTILEQTDNFPNREPEPSWITNWDTAKLLTNPERFTYTNRKVRLTEIVELNRKRKHATFLYDPV